LSREISCPHCNRKLSVRDELVGKRLACPQCKGKFDIPAEAVESPADDTEGDFFDSLSAATPAQAARPAGRSPATPQKLKKAGAKGGAPAARLRRLAGPGGLKGIPPLAWYIAGGAAAAILLIAIVVAATHATPGGRKKAGVVKYGLSEAKRRQIFEELFRSVDQGGEEKATKNDWPKIAAGYKIDAAVLQKILDEGFDAGWEQPGFNNYTAEMKMNRVEWLKKHNQQQHLDSGGRR
jgi:phage FluMu protein Com